MTIPELRWEPSFHEDPDGGTIVLWPYLPCIRMPAPLRPREWDGLALLASSDELEAMKEEEEQDKRSPGVHVESAAASGTTLGILVKDLRDLEVEGPAIPDPEPIRLLHHAENSRGGMPIYSVIPDLDDGEWADWLSRCVDEQVRIRNLLATIGRSKRWAKSRKMAIPKVTPSKGIDADLGAAATVCAAWWLEERQGLTDELVEERDVRIAARLRGALSDLRNSRIDESGTQGTTLLAPVQQAHVPAIEASLLACQAVETMEAEA